MAADAEIQVILRVQDEMTKRLETVEKSMTSLGKSVEAQTKVMTSSFQTSTDGLIALGNVAQSFDNILSTATNTVIQLENAQLRLINAQETAEDTQIKLNRLIDEGKEGTDEYSDAQRMHERATRGVQTAQNNLERVQGRLIGTYISLGVQTVTMIASLPKAAEAIMKLVNAVKLQNIAETISLALKNPLLLAVGLAAAAAGVYAVKTIMAADATTELNSKTTDLDSTLTNTSSNVNTLSKDMEDYASKVTGAIQSMGEEEIKTSSKIIDQEEVVRKAKLAALENTDEEKQLILDGELKMAQVRLNKMKELHKLEFTDLRTNTLNSVELLRIASNEKLDIVEELAKKSIAMYNQMSEAARNSVSFTGKQVAFNSQGKIVAHPSSLKGQMSPNIGYVPGRSETMANPHGTIYADLNVDGRFADRIMGNYSTNKGS